MENGAYRMDNLGDVAMLQVTVARVLARWPGTRVHVLTEQPDRLARAFPREPRVVALSASGWHWLAMTRGPMWLRYNPVANRLRWRARLWQRRRPRLAHALKRAASGRGSAWPDAAAFFEAVAGADAVIATGGGYFADHFHEHADKVLATLGVAQGLGLPTAMFGAGLGPMDRADLRQLAAPVLRGLDVLALREGEVGPRVLEGLAAESGGGVIEHVVTGDDAIEPAADAARVRHERGDERGNDIGVNLRIAGHSQVPDDAPPRVAATLTELARRHGATLVTVPIRCHLSPGNDVDAARATFGDIADHIAARRAELPEDLYPAITRCRVMVTGSYHAAVFALSMGVPAIGLSSSDYYDAKLGGLARMFGLGMEVLDLRAPDLPARLSETVDRLWDEASALREPLAAAAASQVTRSRDAYQQFFDLVQERLTA